MTAKNNLFGLVETAPKSNIYIPDPTGTNAKGVPYPEVQYLLPVFDKATLGGDPNKFNQSAVVGCVMVTLQEVGTSPYNYIKVNFVAGPYVTPGYGGGAYYGVLSNVPKLVQ